MRIYTGGTFDLFHWGHVEFLKECAKFGKVTVALNEDKFIEKFKGKPPVMNFDERKKVLDACIYVNRVIPNFGGENSKPVIVSVMPDIIAIGSDWATKDYYAQMKFNQNWLDARGIKLLYIPYTKDISTTIVKARLS